MAGSMKIQTLQDCAGGSEIKLCSLLCLCKITAGCDWQLAPQPNVELVSTSFAAASCVFGKVCYNKKCCNINGWTSLKYNMCQTWSECSLMTQHPYVSGLICPPSPKKSHRSIWAEQIHEHQWVMPMEWVKHHSHECQHDTVSQNALIEVFKTTHRQLKCFTLTSRDETNRSENTNIRKKSHKSKTKMSQSTPRY